MKTFRIAVIIILLYHTLSLSQSAYDAIRIRQNEIGFGARTLAMGGNGVAGANDYSALYWNPAGLANLRYSEAMGEFSHLNFSNNATFINTTSDLSNNYTRFRNFGMVFPVPTERGSLVFALGYQHVKDFDDYLYYSGLNLEEKGKTKVLSVVGIEKVAANEEPVVMPIGKRSTKEKQVRNSEIPSKKKGKNHEGEYVKARRKRRAPHKFHVLDFPLEEEQNSYSLKEDLASRKANMTFR